MEALPSQRTEWPCMELSRDWLLQEAYPTLKLLAHIHHSAPTSAPVLMSLAILCCRQKTLITAHIDMANQPPSEQNI